MTDPDLDQFVESYKRTASWLEARAKEYETGKAQHLVQVDRDIVDRSAEMAQELRQLAGNLAAPVAAFERLSRKS